jgi:hypothetical protein
VPFAAADDAGAGAALDDGDAAPAVDAVDAEAASGAGGGGDATADAADAAGAGGDALDATPAAGGDEFGDEESVDSDYDFDDGLFGEMGEELLSGHLKLAKVYGQEQPPAAEDELEWEARYFVLHNSKKLVHYDGLQDGAPVGDRGLVMLDAIKSVEKVVGVDTFVMIGENKVYMFKLEPHDEPGMRTWISAIGQQR